LQWFRNLKKFFWAYLIFVIKVPLKKCHALDLWHDTGNRVVWQLNQSDLATLEDFWTPAMLAAPLKARMPGNVQAVADSSLGPLYFDFEVQSSCSENWLPVLYIYIFWVNYNDLTATSLESWLIREIIPKWP
jgi:hypothetical protein